MIYWELFWTFFITNILGYGGGPATIPLVMNEVVEKNQWFTYEEFSEMIASGNALSGPIATKMAGYIGYFKGGVLGSVIAVFATVIPSLLLMLLLMGILQKFRDYPQVKRMTAYVKPTIAVLLGKMAFDMFFSAYKNIGTWHVLVLAVGSFLLFEKAKVHPALVVLGALVYGALLL